ncbi:MAG: hypothetical protein E6G97_21310 [Alphaproteobacteria bacterium]|nr:MAG: hypothetical protein E6G97_21310 [Alphaproteobacteria bacterium]
MARRSKVPDQSAEREYFSSERRRFEVLAKHAQFIGNKIGSQITDERRGMASWLFIKACVASNTIVRLFEPQPSEFGGVEYLDHASIAGLARALIENIGVLLYVGDVLIHEDQWRCRKHIIDLHDYMNRAAFLKGINYQAGPQADEKKYAFLRERVESNPYFKNLPRHRQKRILSGEDMFTAGRHAMMLELGWGEDLTRAVYKYLSNQTHSLPMSFHRTMMNQLYEQESASAMVIAAFATEFARKALGRGCVHMISLFPYIEATLDQLVFSSLTSDYGQQETPQMSAARRPE